MKKALKGPVWLFVAFTFADVARAVEKEGVIKTLPSSAIVFHCGRASLVWLPFAHGQEARTFWQVLVTGPGWEAHRSCILEQPLVHLLPRTGVWAKEPVGKCFAEFTVDATIRTRTDRGTGARPKMEVPGPEILPSGEGVQVWPVLGHPGRLIVTAQVETGLDEARNTWAPGGYPASDGAPADGRTLVETPMRWIAKN